ncbi:MAG: hypothetical protein AAF039_02180 [Bacteroidota bacterium]
MRKIILVFILGLAGSVITFSQDFNAIPTDKQISELPDGWYKFKMQGVVFDVELKQGKYKKGNITWFDGSSYSGDLNGTYLSGRGTYTWSNGSQYLGNFKRHQRHGRGTLVAKDGSKWSGKWKNNQKNGKGTTFDSYGVAINSGVWVGGELIEKNNTK